MYSYRIWQPSDLPWLERAAALTAWEGASEEERAAASPAFVAAGARQQLQGTLSSGMGTAIVAHWEGEPVGFMLFAAAPDSATEEPNGLFMMLWVDPQHRRRGLARNLQVLAEGVLGHMGIRKAKLWTGFHNQAAIRLAQKAGYAPEGILGMKNI